MSRGYCRDPAKDAMLELRNLIFGTGANRRTATGIAKASGLPVSTVNTYRENPEKMPLYKAIRMLRAVNASPEEIGKSIGGRR